MTRRFRGSLRDERGLSMVEIVIAAGIFMCLLVAVLSMLDSGTKAERTQHARHGALVELRDAMARVSKEVRQAVTVTADSTRTKLTIETLRPGDERWVVFELSGTELLTRTCAALPCTGTATSLASNVTATAPFCYDPPSCLSASPGSTVSSVRIALAVQPEVAGNDLPLATDVELRNL